MQSVAAEKSSKEKKGDKHFFEYSFDKAAEEYKSDKNLTTDGQRNLAKSYYNLNLNVLCEAEYSRLLNDMGAGLPEDFFNYAMILRCNKKYSEAEKWMDRYAEIKPDDLRVIDYKKNKSKIDELSKDDGKFQVEFVKANTDAQDFGPSYFKNKIVFASSNKITGSKNRLYNWDNKPFLSLYVADIQGNQLSKSELFDKNFNSKWHDGPASFNKEGTFMAYSKNDERIDKNEKILRIGIYFSKFENGNWTIPVPFILNNKEYSVGHPNLSEDGNTMYFCSSMPGGFGKADVYVVEKDALGNWSQAKNLGNKINTEGDELFPFFDEKNKILMYASNGRYGLGGLDIYITKKENNEFGEIINPGYPLNTTFDDFSAIINSDLTKGYLASNRNSVSGDDDIFSFQVLKPFILGKEIKGFAKDNYGKNVSGAFVSLLDINSAVVDTMTSNFNGEFSFKAEGDKSYKLTAKKVDYTDGFSSLSTTGPDKIIYSDVLLTQKIENEPVTAINPNAGNNANAISLNSIYFDLDKYNIREDAKIELDKIVKTINDNPNLYVQLGSYTDCRASKNYNLSLSQKRAKSAAEYIKKRISRPERITSKGYGENNIVNDCECEGLIISTCSEVDFQKSRRTEFSIQEKIARAE